jgi:hypothetical protein
MTGVHELKTVQLAWNGTGKSTCPGRIVRFSIKHGHVSGLRGNFATINDFRHLFACATFVGMLSLINEVETFSFGVRIGMEENKLWRNEHTSLSVGVIGPKNII